MKYKVGDRFKYPKVGDRFKYTLVDESSSTLWDLQIVEKSKADLWVWIVVDVDGVHTYEDENFLDELEHIPGIEFKMKKLFKDY